jgi:hypothetical protein
MYQNAKTKLHAAKNKLAGVAAIGMTAAMSGPAFAGELASAVTAGLDGAELTLIGVAVLTLTAVVVMIRSGKRAAGG